MSAATLGMSRILAGYIDQTSETMVAAYTKERENWLRNRSAARAAGIRDLLLGERIDVSAAEVTLGYRLRQYHVGLVCWVGDAAGAADEISRLEHAISHLAAQAACSGDPVFQPRGTLLLFLQSGGSYKTAAEQLMLHKNTVQYRIRRAEESLGRPLDGSRQDVELALRASHWLGSPVLQPATAGHDHDPRPRAH